MNKAKLVTYIKRTQKDYTMSFKLSVVQEVESNSISVKGAMRKYDIQSNSTILNWIKKLVILTENYI